MVGVADTPEDDVEVEIPLETILGRSKSSILPTCQGRAVGDTGSFTIPDTRTGREANTRATESDMHVKGKHPRLYIGFKLA